jgi:hypothetical protein
VILENVWCQSRYSTCRMLCPRSIYSWWREVWLERVPDEAAALTPQAAQYLGEYAKPLAEGIAQRPVAASSSAAAQREAAMH